jgi:hypothetical protein
MVSAVSARGELHFGIHVEEGFNAEDFLDFCKKLISDADRRRAAFGKTLRVIQDAHSARIGQGCSTAFPHDGTLTSHKNTTPHLCTLYGPTIHPIPDSKMVTECAKWPPTPWSAPAPARFAPSCRPRTTEDDDRPRKRHCVIAPETATKSRAARPHDPEDPEAYSGHRIRDVPRNGACQRPIPPAAAPTRTSCSPGSRIRPTQAERPEVPRHLRIPGRHSAGLLAGKRRSPRSIADDGPLST